MKKIIMIVSILTCTFTSYIVKAEICSTEEVKDSAKNWLLGPSKFEVYFGTPILVGGEYGKFEIPVVNIYKDLGAASGVVYVSAQKPCEGFGSKLIGLEKAN